MSTRFPWALVFALVLGAPEIAQAQSTDGYHAIQVLPVVVDTASFTQRFYFQNASVFPLNITPAYYPAEGTAEPAPSTCPSFSIGGTAETSFTSLRQICPALAGGSMFGTLILRSGKARPFAVYSRVSNAAGAGFSVEGFAAHTFAANFIMVSGLRRSASTLSAPAYQTNCFVGNLGQITPAASPVSADVTLRVRQDGNLIGSTVISLAPGKLVRLLDVFSAVGDVSNEYDHATAEFEPGNGELGGLLSFCTVQDNTSFGADFRIGKQEEGANVEHNSFDLSQVRELQVVGTSQFNDLTASTRKFEIPAGASSNTHVLYFRHPDYIGCSVIDPATNNPAAVGFGLEMRLLSHVNGTATWEVIAGGNFITSFSDLYLGDKDERGNGGNTTYMLQVESNGVNEGAIRQYKLRCQSGSGHTLGEQIQSGGPVAF